MKHTEADLARARRWLDTHGGRSAGRGKRLAELIADVREECAAKCDAYASQLDRELECDEIFAAEELARRIRGLS